MAKVVTYQNILNPLDRATKVYEVENSKELLAKLNIDTDIYELVISKNQIILKDDFDIIEGDCISISVIPRGGGGGKDIVRSIAMIAVAIAAPMLAPSLLYGIGQFAVIGYGGLATGLATAGIMAAGAMLVNAVLPAQVASYDSSISSNLSSSSTYSWDVLGNSVEQGAPVPVLYGTHRVVPPQISQYVETIDNLQYLNVLYAVADGETTIDTSSILINDEPIGNYDDVQVYTRSGTNDQSIIGIFDDVKSDKDVNIKMDTDWTYSTTTGNSVSGLTIGLLAPSGIYYVNDNGDFEDYTLKVVAQYYYNNQWIYMSGSTSTTQTPISYIIKARWSKYYEFTTLQKAKDALYWEEYYNGILISTLPSNTKLVAGYNSIWEKYSTSVTDNTYSKFTNSLQETLRYTFSVSGLPIGQYQTRVRFYNAPLEGSRYGSDLYYEYLQETVTDDFTMPNTALLALRILATDQLSGSMPVVSVIATNESINNPSDACVDILERSGETLSAKELEKFTEWKTWCDEENYSCNLYFDSIYTVRDALNMVSSLGRATVIQFSSLWSVNIDKPNDLPVQSFLFTMGNIKANSFSESFLPLLERANKIEITYYDETVDYEPQILEVSNANYDTVDEVNVTSINYVGCTNKTMALKYAKYLLNCNRYLTITQNFTVPTELIVGRVGDIIKVAHDLPAIGESGRIVSATTTTITLDREVTMDSGKHYYIEFRYNDTDEIISTEVNNTENTTDTLTFVTPLLTAPEKYDIYSFGEFEKTSKLMRITDISKSSDLESKISCLEYIAEVYDDDEDITPHSESTLGLRGLALNDSLQIENDRITTLVTATWRGTSLYYDVYVNGEFYQKTYSDSIQIKPIVDFNTYVVKIVDSFGDYVEETIIPQGQAVPPPDIENLAIAESGNLFSLTWEYPFKPLDFKEFIIYLDSVEVGRTTAKSFSYSSLGLNKKTFSVTAIDLTKNESEKVSLDIYAQRPSVVDSFHIDNILDAEKTLTWTHNNKPDDLAGYKIKYSKINNRNWDDGTDLVDIVITSSPYKARFAQAQGDYLLMIKSVDTAGNESESASYISFNQGETITDNLIDSYDLKALGWNGTLTNMIEDSGNLIVDNQTEAFYIKNDTDKFYYKNNSDLFYSQFYGYASYSEIRSSPVSGLGIINYQGFGDVDIYYRERYSSLFYKGFDDDLIYNSLDSDLFYDLQDYVIYTHPFNLKANKEYEIKIEYKAQEGRGEITDLEFIVDAPDIIETFDNILISDLNTILTSSKMDYIKNVNVTLQDDSSGATYVKILDKTGNTATIAAYNALDTKVSATADIIVKGYNT